MQESTDNKTEFKTLGQNQIIAKTLLIIFGMFIIFRIANFSLVVYPILSRSMVPQEQNLLILNLVYFGLLIALFACVLYYFIINNSWLIKKIVPAEEPLKNPALWFIVLLRAALVLTGLILLSSNLDTIITAARFIIHLPPALREMITNIIQGNKVFGPVHTMEIYKFSMTILSIYLIAGCPGFVKWQVNKNLKQEIDNE
ncbi:MAG: hypothetical protein ABFD79_10665 [Phycisphaerales bacterium]